MDERLLNRRFINALTAEEAQGIDGRSANGSLKEARQDEEALRKADNPMDAKDAIKRILLAKKDKDFFRYWAADVELALHAEVILPSDVPHTALLILSDEAAVFTPPYRDMFRFHIGQKTRCLLCLSRCKGRP